jgi:nucleotide-binding universal stress UspA family protein
MTARKVFRTILVPLDRSSLAEQALPLAARIAQATGAKVRLALVHAIPAAPLDPAYARVFTALELANRRAERSYLRGVQTDLREGGTRRSSAVTLTGKAGPALLEHVEELGIDLVVMATHGRGGLRRAWLGSVADYLMRRLEVPLLLVRPVEGASPPDRPEDGRVILVGLDGSALAEQVLEPAGELARSLGLELLLLQVVSPVPDPADPTLGLSSPVDQELTNQWRRQAQDYLADMAERLRARGLRASGVAIVGNRAADALLEAASPERVAMIAVATHGHGGLVRTVLGSVADKLVRAADVPVLVYRPTARRTGSRTVARRTGR